MMMIYFPVVNSALADWQLQLSDQTLPLIAVSLPNQLNFQLQSYLQIIQLE